MKDFHVYQTPQTWHQNVKLAIFLEENIYKLNKINTYMYKKSMLFSIKKGVLKL